MSLICLCRAPLNYFAGIPKFCLDLYSSSSFSSTSLASISLDRSPASHYIVHDHFTEYRFPSFFRLGTFSISRSYLKFVLSRLRTCSCVHYNHPDPFSALCLILFSFFHRKKYRLIVTWHADVYLSYFYVAPLLLIIDFIIFQMADKIVYPSPYHIKSSLLAKYKAISKKSLVIPIAIKSVPSSFISRNIQGISTGSSSLRLLSIGRLVSYKGYFDSIAAVRLFLDRNPNVDLTYTIVGSGPLLIKLKEYISYLGLSTIVHIKTSVNDEEKSDFLSKAHIFLFPSITKSEAFGIAQLEAMSFSLPVVNTFLDNGVNYLADSRTVMTVPINSPSDLSDCISKLSSNQLIYSHYSRKSYNKSLLFDIESVRRSYLELFR